MPMPSSRGGFTLIEILCAMGAFILVFLTGSGGLMRLMMTQTNNQQRTVAASAALLLADWHTSKYISAPASFLTNISDVVDPTPTGTVAGMTNNWGATLSDKKKHWRGELPDGSEKVYTFKTSAAAGPYALADLAAYQQIIVTVSDKPIDVSTAEPTTGMKFHVVTFWYGDKTSAMTNISDRFEHLGSYLMPDEKP
jgi:type II secretory pathway pseudopilin PulG